MYRFLALGAHKELESIKQKLSPSQLDITLSQFSNLELSRSHKNSAAVLEPNWSGTYVVTSTKTGGNYILELGKYLLRPAHLLSLEGI